MTSTAHALVAGAIATHIHDPALAALLSLASHYVMDSVPHWDFGTNWRNRPKEFTGLLAIGETLFGIAASYVVFGQTLPIFHWALSVIAGLLPDWLETPWYIFYAQNDKREPEKHASIFERICYSFYKIPNMFHAKAQFPLGIITQIVTVGFFIFLLV